jgi:hypothetical protein
MLLAKRSRAEFARSGWKAVYKKMCKVVEINEEDGLKEAKVSKPFEIEENLMYSEFVEV